MFLLYTPLRVYCNHYFFSFTKKENGVDALSEDTVKAADDFCEGYKKFLLTAKQNERLQNGQLKRPRLQALNRLTLSESLLKPAKRFIS